jgi:hypothetical protein
LAATAKKSQLGTPPSVARDAGCGRKGGEGGRGGGEKREREKRKKERREKERKVRGEIRVISKAPTLAE